jgi:serine protease AprX
MIRKTFVLILFLALFSHLNAQKTDEALSAYLQKSERAPIKVWIMFERHELTAERIAEIRSDMHPRQIERRKKRSRLNLVTKYDIPLHRDHENFLKEHNISYKHFSKWLYAVSAVVSPEQLKQVLIPEPSVQKLQKVRQYRAQLPETLKNFRTPDVVGKAAKTNLLDYGSSFNQVDMLNVPALHNIGINGSGVLIAMLDSGFDNPDHVSITPLDIVDTWDFVNGDADVTNGSDMGEGSHGRQTLSTIGGYAPGNLIGPAYGASYLLAKTENTDWERPIEEDDWAAGAEWAESLGADIISSSLGYTDYDFGFTEFNNDPEDMDGNTAVSTIAADIAAALGVVVVNSAGNSGNSDGSPLNNTLIAPADGDSVLAVGAVTPSETRVSFSSVGPSADGRVKPNVMAQGSSVRVAAFSNSAFTSSQGTSFSAPLVAGVAAEILQMTPSLNPQEVIDALQNTADRADNPDYQYGHGLVNGWDAVFYFAPEITMTPIQNSDNMTGPYPVIVPYEPGVNNGVSEMDLIYKIGQDGQESQLVLSPGDNQFSGSIPGTGTFATVYYRLEYITERLDAMRYPVDGSWLSFEVFEDTEPPVITHTPLSILPLANLPITISARIVDNTNIAEAGIKYRLNDGAIIEQSLDSIGLNIYASELPFTDTEVEYGDSIFYQIFATDNASTPNSAYLPSLDTFYGFEIIETNGQILVIDDAAGVSKSPKTSHSFFTIQNILANEAYYLENDVMDNALNHDWNNYDLIVISSGDNTETINNGPVQEAIMLHLNAGKSVLLEGGEVGYDHRENEVGAALGISSWNSDGPSDLTLNTSLSGQLLSSPYQLPPSIGITGTGGFSDWGTQDQLSLSGNQIELYFTDGSSNVFVNSYQNGHIGLIANNLDAFDEDSHKTAVVANMAKYLIDATFTGIDDDATQMSGQFRLNGNFPNPFNPSTQISFYIPAAGDVRLDVYNTLGQRVDARLLNYSASGEYQLQWNAESVVSSFPIASGLYFYALTFNGNEVINGKMMLLK